MVIAFTDGSAVPTKNHPFHRYGGMAVVFVASGEVVKVVNKGYMNTTSNRMELMAVITALRLTEKNQLLMVYSDSRYVIDAFAKGWIYQWELNNWSCKNSDLMRTLLVEYQMFTPGAVRFRHVKGHGDSRYNMLADMYASYSNFTEFEQDLNTIHTNSLHHGNN